MVRRILALFTASHASRSRSPRALEPDDAVGLADGTSSRCLSLALNDRTLSGLRITLRSRIAQMQVVGRRLAGAGSKPDVEDRRLRGSLGPADDSRRALWAAAAMRMVSQHRPDGELAGVPLEVVDAVPAGVECVDPHVVVAERPRSARAGCCRRWAPSARGRGCQAPGSLNFASRSRLTIAVGIDGTCTGLPPLGARPNAGAPISRNILSVRGMRDRRKCLSGKAAEARTG